MPQTLYICELRIFCQSWVVSCCEHKCTNENCEWSFTIGKKMVKVPLKWVKNWQKNVRLHTIMKNDWNAGWKMWKLSEKLLKTQNYVFQCIGNFGEKLTINFRHTQVTAATSMCARVFGFKETFRKTSQVIYSHKYLRKIISSKSDIDVS